MDKQELKNLGLKVTSPRLKILNLLQSDDIKHWSADDIYRQLLEQGEELSLATIYRVLTQFHTAGLLIRHNFEGGHSIFELQQGEHHDHLVCVKCGKVEEFVDATIEQRQQAIAEQHNFQMTEHNLTIYGVCQHCQAISL